MLAPGFYNVDCMEGMKQFPDKYFELAIVDPPHFSGPEKREYYGRKTSPIGVKRHYKPSVNWSIPGEKYFAELSRVSKNQIIWGCNYYQYIFGPGRIIWDKVNGESSFSDAEEAYCSLHDSTRLIRYMWNGMMQGKSISEGWIQQGDKSKNEKRIHPTQKPVKVLKKLIEIFTDEGDVVIDPCAGSGTTLRACMELNRNSYGFEIGKDFCRRAKDEMLILPVDNQIKLNEWLNPPKEG